MKHLEDLQLSIIASYGNGHQEFIDMLVYEDDLVDEQTLIENIKSNLDKCNSLSLLNLCKLSLCWVYQNKNRYNAQQRRFPVMQQIVNRNGKYFFNKGELDV